MSGQNADMNLVQRFWALYQARDWATAQALLHPEAACQWWATAERFEGAAAVVHVNAVYPEGWTIHLLELNALDGVADAAPSSHAAGRRVHSLVRVNQGEQVFYANSFFVLEQGLIVSIDEYWADAQQAPAWRTTTSLPGLCAMPADARPGLSLELE